MYFVLERQGLGFECRIPFGMCGALLQKWVKKYHRAQMLYRGLLLRTQSNSSL